MSEIVHLEVLPEPVLIDATLKRVSCEVSKADPQSTNVKNGVDVLEEYVTQNPSV